MDLSDPQHAAAVAKIQETIAAFHDKRIAFRIGHDTTFTARNTARKREHTIDISGLNRVLDFSRDTVTVEANVSTERLYQDCQAKNKLPLLTVELPRITVGGAFCGLAGESTSFRVGLFHETVDAIEVVLANGERRVVNRMQNQEMFYGFANSCGTLGVLTALQLRLRDWQPFVSLRYLPISSIETAVATFTELGKDPETDFLDGMMFSATNGVVCHGRLTSQEASEGLPHARFTRASDPWFYTHAQKRAAIQGETPIEAIPTYDYVFRYERGGFWMGKYAFEYFCMPFNDLTRRLLNSCMQSAVSLKAFQSSGLNDRYMVQDVAVPMDRASEMMAFLESEFAHYPVFLCPIRNTGPAQWSFKDIFPNNFGLNFGAYGPGPADPHDFIALNRSLEEKTRKLGGSKALYAQLFCTAEDFWGCRDVERYEALRRECGAEGWLPDIYTKLSASSLDETKVTRWWRVDRPWRGFYGVAKAVVPLLLKRT